MVEINIDPDHTKFVGFGLVLVREPDKFCCFQITQDPNFDINILLNKEQLVNLIALIKKAEEWYNA